MTLLASLVLAAPAGAETGGVALLTFVSSSSAAGVVHDPAAMRRASAALLAQRFRDRGLDVLTYPELEGPMRAHRIRSERDLDTAFLAHLRDDFGAEVLVLARFAVGPDDLVLLARGLSTSSGLLDWVEVVEAKRDHDQPEEAVLRIVGRLLETIPPLGERGATEPDGARLAVLPLRPVGLDRNVGDIATHCLLRSLVVRGRWAVPDPAPLSFALQQQGLDPLLLEPDTRHWIATELGADRVIVPRLEGFPLAFQPSRTAPLTDGDTVDFDDVELRERPVHFALVEVRCDTGRVVDGATEYLVPEARVGMFGTRKHVPATRRFRIGADRLVRSLYPEENGS